jgi:hypothetical protein
MQGDIRVVVLRGNCVCVIVELISIVHHSSIENLNKISHFRVYIMDLRAVREHVYCVAL